MFRAAVTVAIAMSSPASRRSKRTSASSTPVRPVRNTQQPPNGLTAPSAQSNLAFRASSSQQGTLRGTPASTRQTVASSSPLFFRSSPANGAGPVGNHDRMEISSPLQQASSIAEIETTPRGRPHPLNGTSMFRIKPTRSNQQK